MGGVMRKGKIIGYIRVSLFDRNTEKQLETIELDKVYTDKGSGKNIDREQLKALISYMRDGDTVVIHSMDRLARNLDDLRNLVRQFNKKQVKVRFIKENLTFNGDDSAMSTELLQNLRERLFGSGRWRGLTWQRKGEHIRGEKDL